MSKYIANIVTVSRIIFSVLLLFTAPFLVYFYIFYLICGISDMIDGSIARYFHTESETGSKLDLLADFVFFALVSVKLVREIKISSIFMVWSGLFFAVRLICIGINCKKDKNEFAAHSFLDKLTGFLLFIKNVDLNTMLTVLCFSASLAAGYEFIGCLKYNCHNVIIFPSRYINVEVCY